MANPEHVEIVKQGAEAICRWQEANPSMRLDLSRAYLAGRYLYGAPLIEADLVQANLREATLIGADLTRANLTGANLTATNLTQAILAQADFFETNLALADLTGATLTGAIFFETVLGNTNLTAVQDLDTCAHAGPSLLDYRTLLRSGGLPEVFLRGCGWPDELIAVVPTLLQNPIQFYSCFISYSSQDEDFAKRLHADLQAHGVRCWFAPEDMKIGDRLRVRIDESIRLHDKLLLILSEHSMASQWVEQEVETAMEREEKQGGTVLFPIRIDDAVMGSQAGWAHLIRRWIGEIKPLFSPRAAAALPQPPARRPRAARRDTMLGAQAPGLLQTTL
jgi:hypothetical protein